MKDTDLAYIAGIIDGEGYAGYTTQHDRKQPRQTFSLRISNTDHALLLWIQETLHGIAPNARVYELKGAPQTKQCYQYVTYGETAKNVLRACGKYLRIKGEDYWSV